jgi:protein-L-isoaspartate(D-aspartate) O-methyltransferase
MAEAAQIGKNDKVLEVGTGSGYSAAMLANLAQEVFTIENIPELAEAATARLFSLGYSNVRVKQGDGSVGWPEAGPFDAIIVTAAAPKVPPSLKIQLKPLGRLVIPVAAQDSGAQGEALMRVTKIPSGGGFSLEYLTGVRFVPLVGQEGFPKSEEE